MATYTSNYAWTKPSGNDNVDISVLNANLDSQDSIMHDAFMNMAQAFSESSTYEVGDIVVYGTTTYKCHTAVTTAGAWTGSTNWQVYRLSEGGGGGGTSDYPDLTNKPQINGVTLSGNKTASDLSLQDKMQYSTMPTASADNEGKIYQYVGTTDANYTNGYYYKCVENSGSYSWQLVENIKEQTPTFSQAGTRNNIASGDKLSVIMGKIAKFFNDLKTVAFSGSYTDLTNQPQINGNTLSGNKTTSDLGINADNVMMSDGVTSVEDALDDLKQETIISITPNGVKTYGQYFPELYTAIHNYDGIRKQSLTLQIGSRIFNLSFINNTECQFSMFAVGAHVYSRGIALTASTCAYKLATDNTITDLINDVPTSIEIMTVYQ